MLPLTNVANGLILAVPRLVKLSGASSNLGFGQILHISKILRLGDNPTKTDPSRMQGYSGFTGANFKLAEVIASRTKEFPAIPVSFKVLGNA